MSIGKKIRSHVTCDVTGVYMLFQDGAQLGDSDSADSGSEISEIDVEILNNAAAEIVLWRFDLRGCPRDERLHFDRENESANRDDRLRNTDWRVSFDVCKFTPLAA